MIIEIPFGTMHAVLDREQMGHRFFGGGLAHRAGHGDGRLAPHFSHRRRERLQRDQSVIDDKQSGRVGIARQLPLPDHRGNRTPAQRLLDEVVTVEAFAFDREEKFAGLRGAGIDGISLGHRMTVVLAGRRLAGRCLLGRSNEFGDARQKKFHAVFHAEPAFAALLHSCPRANRLSRATSTSSKGIVPSFAICPFSCPLPASNTMSPGAACCRANAMALRRSGSMVYFAPDFCSPTSASFMMASGSSERGLSDVSTTKSLPLPAASPISGRLARSRSPPHPKSVMTLPLSPARTTKSRASTVRLRSASSVCA